MSSFLQKIKRLTIMETSRLTQYRADLVLWTLAILASALISMALWYTVAKESGDGQLAHTTLVYYIFVSFLSTITVAWAGYYIAQGILDGTITKELIRPFPVFWFHIVNNMVEKGARLFIPLPILILAIIFIPSFFEGSLVSLPMLPIALICIALAIVLAFFIDISLGLLAFWLQDAMQIRRYQDLLYEITSGVLIPYSFMPEGVKTIFSILPYRYIISAPAEILSGQADFTQALQFIGMQITWIIGLSVVVWWQWKRGLARYAPPG